MDIKIDRNFFDKKIIIVVIIIASLMLGVGILIGNKFLKTETKSELSKEEVGSKTIDYINEKFLQGQNQVASLISISEESGVYKLKLKIGTQEFTSYVTKDGKFLFPQAFDMIPKITEIPKTEKPDVKLFVMSFCPFGNQAEDLIIPIVNLLKDKANISLVYIVSKDKDGKFSSLHGDQELHQDVRELCVAKYQQDKFWDFIKEINNKCTANNADNCWESVAQQIGIDIEKIKKCQEEEQDDLLNSQVALTEKQYQVQDPSQHQGNTTDIIVGSPTLVINDVIYDGSRTSEDYKNAICSAFINPPKECNQKLSESAGEVQGGCK
jgi:hypothetical protein